MLISKDFPGGNIWVISMEGDVVRLENEIRDTTEDWFYWAFHVTGCAGKTVTFDFSPKPWIGYWGPAVSHDLEAWTWGGVTALLLAGDALFRTAGQHRYAGESAGPRPLHGPGDAEGLRGRSVDTSQKNAAA